ncbi:uncharacterized protein LOC119986560 [Tripterygium wilfordii]|uniref:uncharacterized protein LOC119986560 n=1 Tax=Tripterygium wilfordii TaxID=458696 RepID=UPI0018F84C6A|nr:uncharacterized protein LOC119986560 [Tripterygium wilfordii]
MDEARAQPVCAQEALDLLTCVTQSPFDHAKCVQLLNSSRECVLNKANPKDVLPDHHQPCTVPMGGGLMLKEKETDATVVAAVEAWKHADLVWEFFELLNVVRF